VEAEQAGGGVVPRAWKGGVGPQRLRQSGALERRRSEESGPVQEDKGKKGGKKYENPSNLLPKARKPRKEFGCEGNRARPP